MKGFIFDIEDVFFDGTFFHRYLHQMMCRLGCPEKFRQIQTVWQTRFLPMVYQGQLQYWDALASFFSSRGLPESQVRELIVGAQSRLRVAQANLRLFPGVSEAMAMLRKQERQLAIVCNSIHEPDKLEEMLRRIHLRTPFDFVLTSFAAKRVMPDAGAFEAVCQAAHLNPEDLGYVSTRDDRLQLASQFGMRTIQLVRPPAQEHLRSRFATYMITGLQELSGLEAARIAV